MIVRCINDSVSNFDDHDAEIFRSNVHLDEINLSKGESYFVFGLLFRNATPWFLICEEPEDEYPKPHFSKLFEVIDARIPEGWRYQSISSIGEIAVVPEIFAQDPLFLEKLIDGDQRAISGFANLKRRLKDWHNL